MRTSLLPTIAVVALLVLAGCTGPGTTNPQAQTPTPTTTTEQKAPPDVSPDTFPSASEINRSVFERNANEMGNTSFTILSVLNRTDRNPESIGGDIFYDNRSRETLFDTDDSQYLEYWNGGVNRYWDGEMMYRYLPEQNKGENQGRIHRSSVFNKSGPNYLWNGLLVESSWNRVAINATYEREGVEWFNDTAVMRYEATGVDALPERIQETELYKDFTATLLLTENGVIRHFEYTFEKKDEYDGIVRIHQSLTITDIGTTDVEKPDWVTELQESE